MLLVEAFVVQADKQTKQVITLCTSKKITELLNVK